MRIVKTFLRQSGHNSETKDRKVSTSCADPKTNEPGRLGEVPGVRILTPESCEFFKGVYSLLHVQLVEDDIGPGLYRAVHAVRAFPVSSPDGYIVLKYPDEYGIEREVGLILDLNIFPPGARDLVLESLAAEYFEYEIERIHDVKWRYQLLFCDVETTQGRREFQMRRQAARVQNLGDNGKVLLDVSDIRYVIRDLDLLPKQDRRKFFRYIYW